MSALHCPHCKAPSNVSPDAPVVTCPYCGAQSRNELYRAPPPPKAESEATVIPGWMALLFFLMIIALIGITSGILVWVTSPQNTLEEGDQANDSAARWHWQSPRPLIVDLNGDGVEDILGRIRDQKSLHFFVAVSGEDFRILWKTPQVSDRAKPYIAQDKLLIVEDNHLKAFTLAKGKSLWQVLLPDKVAQIALVNEFLSVNTINKSWSALRLADGQQVAQLPPQAIQVPLDSDDGSTSPAPLLELSQDQWPNLLVRRSFCESSKLNRPRTLCSSPYGLAIAINATGSKVPHVIGYDRASGTHRWWRQLTPQGSVAELETEPQAELLNDKALLLYKAHGQPTSLELFSLTEGRSLWSASIAANALKVRLTAQRAYLANYMNLFIFESSSGRHVSTLGWKAPSKHMGSSRTTGF